VKEAMKRKSNATKEEEEVGGRLLRRSSKAKVKFSFFSFSLSFHIARQKC
jgi:hypothetical protein